MNVTAGGNEAHAGDGPRGAGVEQLEVRGDGGWSVVPLRLHNVHSCLYYRHLLFCSISRCVAQSLSSKSFLHPAGPLPRTICTISPSSQSSSYAYFLKVLGVRYFRWECSLTSGYSSFNDKTTIWCNLWSTHIHLPCKCGVHLTSFDFMLLHVIFSMTHRYFAAHLSCINGMKSLQMTLLLSLERKSEQSE